MPPIRYLAAFLCFMLALMAHSLAVAQGWERTYGIRFANCDQRSQLEFGAAMSRFPGFLDQRPHRCGGTYCDISYTSTIQPARLLNELQAMLDRTGYRGRVGVDRTQYHVTCLPGRRVHPLVPNQPKPLYREYRTPCGTLIDAAGDVLFDFDKAFIRSDAVPVLIAVAERIRENRPFAVEITGHTDARGSQAYNQRLSERRAGSVARYISNAPGLRNMRMIVSGRGELEPVAPNTFADGSDYPEGRQLNRRVEIFLRNRTCN